MKTYEKLVIFMVVVLLICGCTAKEPPRDDTDDENMVEIEPIVVEDKEPIEQAEAEEPYEPVGVMIENSTAARPQSG